MLPSQIHKIRGVVITLSGPSGVGKGTVISKVIELSPEMKHSISVTTREPRPGEKNGVDYFFIDNSEFEKMIMQGEILEYDKYCGNYYGTPKDPLLKCIDEGKDIIMDITVPGSLSVLNNFPEAVSIFLLPPSFSELQRRLIKRGTESEDAQKKRLDNAFFEIGMTHNFEYVLVNDDLELTARRILSIAEAEKHRYKRLKGIEKALFES